MASYWFVRGARGVKGPLTLKQIEEGLKRGRFTFADLVIEEGGSQWRVLLDSGLFPRDRQTSFVVGPTEGMWMVYLHRAADPAHSKPKYSGPHTTSDLLTAIRAGKFSYSDYGCRFSGTEWRRLGDWPDFQGSSAEPPAADDSDAEFVVASAKDVEAIVAPDSREDIERAIVRSGAKTLSNAHELPPAEADGIDLLEPPEWLKIVGKLFVFTAFFTVAIGGHVARAASGVRIVPIKMNGPTPSLVFESDAAPGETIEVAITGRPGQILGLKSYRYHTKITRQNGEVPTLNLAALQLPQGQYRASVQIGQAGAQHDFFIGQRDAKFAGDLKQYRKSIAADLVLEKRLLFYGAKTQLQLVQKLTLGFRKFRTQPERWRTFAATWGKDHSRSRTRLDQYIARTREPWAPPAFPEALARLSSASERLHAYSQELDQAVARTRDPASVPEPALAKEFAQLKKDAAQISVDF